MTEPRQFLPQLDVIVNFTVEYNLQRSILVRYRLPPSLDIDDAQSSVPQANCPIHEVPMTIRPTMLQRRGHALKKFPVNGLTGSVIYSGNSAHTTHLFIQSVRNIQERQSRD